MRAARALVLSTLAVSGCAHESGHVRPDRETALESSSSCPTAVPGTRVREEDTPAGAALVFSAPHERVDEVRDRADHLVGLHNAQHDAYVRGALGGQPLAGTGMTGEQGAAGFGPEAAREPAPGRAGREDAGPARAGRRGTAEGPVGMPGGTGLVGPLLRSTARAEDTARGSRIFFDAADPSDIRYLRHAVSRSADEMHGARCPILDMHMQAQPERGDGEVPPPVPNPSR